MVRNVARDLAPTLVRDQGAEERVTYLDYQLNGRSLPALDKDDWRELRGPQLEHLATSQCEYFVHKSMRETLDYEAHGTGYGCGRQFLFRKQKAHRMRWAFYLVNQEPWYDQRILVGCEWLEHSTYGLRVRCSTN